MTAVSGHVLSLLDFALPCESTQEGGAPCPYMAPAEWILHGTGPRCGHRLAIFICDYCRSDWQTWCVKMHRSRAVWVCTTCKGPLGRPIFDVYRLTPMRPT